MTNFARVAALARRAPDLGRRRERCAGGATGRRRLVEFESPLAGPQPLQGLPATARRFRSLARGRAAARLRRRLARARRALGQAARGVGLCHADHRPLRTARHHERLHERAASRSTLHDAYRALNFLVRTVVRSIRAASPWLGFSQGGMAGACSRSSAADRTQRRPKNSARRSASIRPALASRAT